MTELTNFPEYTAEKFPEYRQYLITRDQMPNYTPDTLPEDYDWLLTIPYNNKTGETARETADIILHFYTNGKKLCVIKEFITERQINSYGKFNLKALLPIQVPAWFEYCTKHNTDSFGNKYGWGLLEIIKGELITFQHTVRGFVIDNLSRWRTDLDCDEIDLPMAFYQDPKFQEMWQNLAKKYPVKAGDVEAFDEENHLK